jgi:hypothetical protein
VRASSALDPFPGESEALEVFAEPIGVVTILVAECDLIHALAELLVSVVAAPLGVTTVFE